MQDSNHIDLEVTTVQDARALLQAHKPIWYYRRMAHVLGYDAKDGTYNGSPGDDIWSACQALAGVVQLANTGAAEDMILGRFGAKLRWNDIVLTCTHEDTADTLIAKWDTEIERRRAAYWTPERLAAKAAEEQAAVTALAEHFYTALQGTLAPVLRSGHGSEEDRLADLVRWFLRLEELSFTYASLGAGEREYLVALCADLGITAGMNCSDDEIAWRESSRVHKLQWLLGQCLDGTLSVGCPHQIVHKFAEDLGVTA